MKRKKCNNGARTSQGICPFDEEAGKCLKCPDSITVKKKQVWNYEKMVEDAKEAIKQWKEFSKETMDILYTQKKLLARQKGQSKNRYAKDYVPTWKKHCEEIYLPEGLADWLKNYNALAEYVVSEKKKERAGKTKRRGL